MEETPGGGQMFSVAKSQDREADETGQGAAIVILQLSATLPVALDHFVSTTSDR